MAKANETDLKEALLLMDGEGSSLAVAENLQNVVGNISTVDAQVCEHPWMLIKNHLMLISFWLVPAFQVNGIRRVRRTQNRKMEDEGDSDSGELNIKMEDESDGNSDGSS
jgi:hypothetical protein